MTWLRSALFNLFFFGFSASFAVSLLPLLPLPRRWLLAPIRLWAGLVILMLRLLCGIRVRVTGREHLPAEGGAALVAAKHQSAFDTVVWLWLLPDPAYVLKRELLDIPVWGWLARGAGMIAVDRLAGASAMRHLLRAGQAAAAEGRQMVIFPEGTRVPPGERRPYQPGVVALAAATGLPVIPVATDSGLRWGRRAFHKRPGVITVAVLPPLPAGLQRDALLRRLEEAIEPETRRLSQRGEVVDNSVD
jgi:1-acyl-sn-glycerol-3-phosphate acyltransferase